MSRFRTIAITGASSGLGAALAEAYAEKGVVLMLAGRDLVRLQAVQHQCEQRGARVMTAAFDIRDDSATSRWIQQADQAHGLDLVIANAGISAGSLGTMEAKAQVEAIFGTNVTGVLNTVNAAQEGMIRRKAGHIAIVSSLAALLPLPSCPSYSASKAAMRIYGAALSPLLKSHGVGLTMILPGYIRTPMTAVNPFPMPGIVDAALAAKRIKRQLMHAPQMIIFPLWLYLLLRVVAMLPQAVQSWLVSKLPGKPSLQL